MQIRVSGVEQRKLVRKTTPWNSRICSTHTKKEMLLRCNFRDSFCGMWNPWRKKNADEDGRRVSRLWWVLFSGVYLRQGLHNGVQQSSHPHRHLQELQYCGDTQTHRMKKQHLTNIMIFQSYITEQACCGTERTQHFSHLQSNPALLA